MTLTHSPVPPGAEFAFGESPFKAKGSLYLGTQKYFKKNAPGGMAALIECIGPGPLADFIGQVFLPAFWYDALPAPALIVHEAKAMKLSVDDYLVQRTTWQVGQDVVFLPSEPMKAEAGVPRTHLTYRVNWT